MILTGVLIFTVVTYRNEGSDRAARKASSQAQYAQCIGSIPILARFERFIVGVREVGDVLLLNSVKMHQISKPGSAVYRTQEKNIKRLRDALNKQRNVNVPQFTVATCRAAQRARQ